MHLENIKKVHCVGIGGIGISAIARLFVDRGATVSGSDMNGSPVTEGLRDIGVTVHIGHDTENLPEETDLVVHTIAVPADNPEIIAAKKAGIQVLTYPEMLGLLSKNMYTVAVSGTHGKTTTTAMLAEILIASGKNPTVIVGSLLHKQKSNFIAGDGDILIVEACEYRRSFLNLHPNILVITNIDADHLDYFKDISDIQNAFSELAGQVADDGFVVCDPEAPNLLPVIDGTGASIVDFADISIEVELEVPGEHNRQNARAAMAAAEKLDVSLDESIQSIQTFSGTWRRAQKKGKLESGALIYDDYGHHPTEVRSTLAGFHDRFPDRKLVVAFQPHLYSRTREFMDEFSESFDDADQVILLPIYAARELPDPEVSSDLLANRMAGRDVSVQMAADFDDARRKIMELADENTLILTQGAGDVYKIADNLLNT